jgi:hypothetical protein
LFENIAFGKCTQCVGWVEEKRCGRFARRHRGRLGIERDLHFKAGPISLYIEAASKADCIIDGRCDPALTDPGR